MVCNKIFTFNMQIPSVVVNSWLASREHITIFCPILFLQLCVQYVIQSLAFLIFFFFWWLIANLCLCHMHQVMHEYIQKNNYG